VVRRGRRRQSWGPAASPPGVRRRRRDHASRRTASGWCSGVVRETLAPADGRRATVDNLPGHGPATQPRRREPPTAPAKGQGCEGRQRQGEKISNATRARLLLNRLILAPAAAQDGGGTLELGPIHGEPRAWKRGSPTARPACQSPDRTHSRRTGHQRPIATSSPPRSFSGHRVVDPSIYLRKRLARASPGPARR